ncbi:MAG: hypothetical protein WAT12_10280, partial [Candidatus Nitrotoga sp.]
NNTITTSTSSSTFFESPPVCNPVGSSRFEQAVTLEDTIGPGTIIIGDRDAGGTAFQVLAGTQNLNVNTHTTFFRCVAVQAVPLGPWVPVGSGVGVLLAFLLMRRRRKAPG